MTTVASVIPIYNGARFVSKAIESVLSQSRIPDEVICVDDGSTDESVDIVRKYPVRLITQKNGGPASARNAGILASSSDWIAFLDHDDTWHSNKTEFQLNMISETVDAIFCEKTPNSENLGVDDFFIRNYGGNPSGSLIRRSALIELGLFDESRTCFGVDDYDFWLRFIHAGRKYVTTPNLYNFTPADNHYGGKYEEMLDAECYVINKFATLADLDPEIVAERIRKLEKDSIPSLISIRKLERARSIVLSNGLLGHPIGYYSCFLPSWILNIKRRIYK